MTDKSWKRAEREVARRLGGRRIPVSGRQRGDAPDIEHLTLSIEVKHRESLPAWLLDAMDQARASCRDEQLAIAVLHQRGMRYEQSLVVIDLSSLARLLAGRTVIGTGDVVAGHIKGNG